MVNQKLANFIIHDLSIRYHSQEGLGVNSSVISDVVEGWNHQVYVVPNQAVKFRRKEQGKYILM